MAENWERRCREMARAALGAGVGYCHDVGYTREHVLAYVRELYDMVDKTKQRIADGVSVGETIDLGVSEAVAAETRLVDSVREEEHAAALERVGKPPKNRIG